VVSCITYIAKEVSHCSKRDGRGKHRDAAALLLNHNEVCGRRLPGLLCVCNRTFGLSVKKAEKELGGVETPCQRSRQHCLPANHQGVAQGVFARAGGLCSRATAVRLGGARPAAFQGAGRFGSLVATPMGLRKG
jgi:hypothetical protein